MITKFQLKIVCIFPSIKFHSHYTVFLVEAYKRFILKTILISIRKPPGTIVPFLWGQLFCNEKVSFKKGGLSWRGNLQVFYYLNASEIWSHKSVALSVRGISKGGTLYVKWENNLIQSDVRRNWGVKCVKK